MSRMNIAWADSFAVVWMKSWRSVRGNVRRRLEIVKEARPQIACVFLRICEAIELLCRIHRGGDGLGFLAGRAVRLRDNSLCGGSAGLVDLALPAALFRLGED